MKRSLFSLLVVATLVLLFVLLGRPDPQRPNPTPGVDSEPPAAIPLPGYREEASPKDREERGARLKGRPPPEEERDLLVQVIDPDGTPVPQALLIVERGAGEDWQEWVETVRAGEVRIAGPKGKQTTHLDVSDPKDAAGAPLALLPCRLEDVRPGQDEVVVELAWSRRLVGTVRSTSGAPVEGAKIRASPFARFSAGREALTDVDGRFEILGLPPGELTVRLAKNERWVGPGLVHVEIAQDRIDLEVVPLRPFTITVLDPHGDVIEGIWTRTRWSSLGVPQEFTAATDAEGCVVVPSVPDSAMLFVSTEWREGAPDYADFSESEVSAEDGALTLRLPAPAVVEGYVTDPQGRPIPEGVALLNPLPSRAERAGPLEGGMAQVEDGRFRIDRLASGPYHLVVTGSGLGNDAIPPFEVTAPSTRVDVVLHPYVPVRGRVLDAQPTQVVVQWFADHAPARMARVDPDGTFLIDGVLDGPGSLYAFHKDRDAACVVERLTPGDGPFDVECEDAKRIAGRVPAYEARTWNAWAACVRGPVRLPVRVQLNGSFEVRGVPPGRWRLAWQLGVETSPGLQVEAGTLDVVLPLPDSARGER